MTDDRSLERAARSWLEEGPTRAPDRAVEAALAQVQTTSQERDLRVPWRYNQMTRPLQIAVGAAAAVLVVTLIVTVLPDRFGGVGNDASGPPSTATESPGPSATVLMEEGPLAAGTYVTHQVFPVRITFTVPDGWSADNVASDATILGSESAYFSFFIVDEPQRDPCGLGGASPSPVGPTGADLAAALAGAPGFDTTGPADISIGGLEGLYVELIGPLEGCTETTLWSTPSGGCRCWSVESHSLRNRLWIVDVDGTRLVVDVEDGGAPPGTDAAALAEVDGMIDSIQISR